MPSIASVPAECTLTCASFKASRKKLSAAGLLQILAVQTTRMLNIEATNEVKKTKEVEAIRTKNEVEAIRTTNRLDEIRTKKGVGAIKKNRRNKRTDYLLD